MNSGRRVGTGMSEAAKLAGVTYARKKGHWLGRRSPSGRKSKLTKETQVKIVQALTGGNYAQTAAAYAGIGVATYYEWLARGAAERARGLTSPFTEFADAVKKAEADAEVRAVALVQQAMPGNWVAAMTWLERRFPSRWRRQSQHQLAGEGGGPIENRHTVDVRKLSTATLERILEELGDSPGPGRP